MILREIERAHGPSEVNEVTIVVEGNHLGDVAIEDLMYLLHLGALRRAAKHTCPAESVRRDRMLYSRVWADCLLDKAPFNSCID